jgi:hypothetical protein
LELAKVGEPLQIFTKDVVSDMMTGSPVLTAQSNTRTVKEGDVETDPDKQAPAAPPSLRNPGEKLPTDNTTTGVMRPVQFPKPHPDETPGANPDEQPTTPPASTQPAQPQPAPANTPPAASSSQQPPAGTGQNASSSSPSQPN